MVHLEANHVQNETAVTTRRFARGERLLGHLELCNDRLQVDVAGLVTP